MKKLYPVRKALYVFFIMIFEFTFEEGKITASLLLTFNKSSVLHISGIASPVNSDDHLDSISDFCNLRLREENLKYYHFD